MENDAPMSETDSQAAAASIVGGIDLNVAFGAPVEEQPIWVGLYESIRDVFFPPHLPPLELTSTPIPVPDRMAVKPNPWAFGIATSLNLAVLAVLLFVGVTTVIKAVTTTKLDVTKVDVPTEFKAPRKDVAAGGGGGSPDKMEAIKGRIPPRMQPLEITPKIEAPIPSIDVQKDIVIPDNPTLPNFGQSNSTNVKLGSLGNGSGMGVGNGNGNGYGDGTGGNIGGGLYRVGGGVSAPVPLNSVEAEFSDEARRAKYQGICLISLIVDAQGNPQNPRVVQALGMGLDEKALEAVRKYKFKPAMKDGKTPVPVMITVLVNFHLY
jgi:TonB family protein